MAVITGIEDVNSGLTGWTKADVMTSLEKVFYNLTWNGDASTQKVGVPVICLDPGGNFDEPSHDSSYESNPLTQRRNWDKCSGGAVAHPGSNSYYTRYYRVKNNGTTDYQISEELIISSQSFDGNNSNYFTVQKNDWTTGDEVIYGAPDATPGTYTISGLTVGQTYYIVKAGTEQSPTFGLAATQSDALAATPVLVEMTDTSYQGSNVHYRLSSPYVANPTLNIYQQDKLVFEIDDNSGGTFNIINYDLSAYAADRVLNDTNTTYSSNLPSGVGTNADPLEWNTSYWNITETEIQDPTKITGTGNKRTFTYGYASDTHSTMKGQIIINMSLTEQSGNGWNGTYYKYTVSGAAVDANNPGTGRTDLNLRIHRDCTTSYQGQLTGITITNVAENWQDNDIFTIPGDQIGGESPANDIVFGVNQAEQIADAKDGTPSIHVTTLGAGQNLYQKHPDGHFAVAKIVNDANKTFGTTYWGFALADNMYELSIDCGPNWTFLNRPGTNCTAAGSNRDFGFWSGDMGMDYQNSYNYIPSSDGQMDHRNHLNIASTTSTTNYPLQIRTYKAQSPQDDNFAVIQFVQLQDTKVIPYATFTMHTGPNYGNDIFDLDHVYLGSYTEYETERQVNNGSGCKVTTRTRIPQYHYYSNQTVQDEPVNSASKAREALYGYMRNPDNPYYPETEYICNIDIAHGSGSYVDTYFRDSTYDRFNRTNAEYYQNPMNVDNLSVVSSSQNYYKPIKGIPLSHTFAPCPYYLPDDFVMIQAAVTPGGTTFRPGDTVEVATNEKYVIIVGDEYNDQEGLDGIAGNTAKGMLFCGRLAN
mgnify:CR=1 FL=1